MQKLVAITLFAAAAAAGCAAPDESETQILILNNQSPNDDCAVMPDEGGFFYSSGRIDALSTRGYLLSPLVKNFSTTGGNDDLVAQRTFFAEGLDVSLASSQYPQLDSAFSVPTSGSIGPDGGLSAFFIEIIPTATMNALASTIPTGERTTLVANMRMFGTQGSNPIETREFSYPIEVCNGCGVVNLGPCSLLPDGFMGSPGGACNPVQDGVLECCTSLANVVVCPAEPEDPAPAAR